MSRRQSLISQVLERLRNERLVSLESKDLDKDSKLFRRMLERRREDVGIHKDPDKGILWFKKRK